jgi:benzoylformate decarboxylase
VAARVRGDCAAIAAAAELLSAAQRPVIVAGDAVAQSRAHAELVELAELLGAPVYTELLPSTASFPASHPLFHGAVVPRAPAVRQLLEQHDLLLSVGADLFTLPMASVVDAMPSGMRVIHIDADPWQLGKNYPAAVAILGDAKATLTELVAALGECMTTADRRAAQERRRVASDRARATRAALVARARALADRTPVEPLALLEAIGSMLPRDAIVIEEATSSADGIRELIRSDDPQAYFGLRGGAVGWGMPAAIGVKLALPDRPVLALLGDGGTMYTCQALWTAAHERVAVVFVVLNNGSYRILKKRLHAQNGSAARSGRYPGTELDDPAIDFAALARSLGVASALAANVAQATDLIADGLQSSSALLVEVDLDRSFATMDEASRG